MCVKEADLVLEAQHLWLEGPDEVGGSGSAAISQFVRQKQAIVVLGCCETDPAGAAAGSPARKREVADGVVSTGLTASQVGAGLRVSIATVRD